MRRLLFSIVLLLATLPAGAQYQAKRDIFRQITLHDGTAGTTLTRAWADSLITSASHGQTAYGYFGGTTLQYLRGDGSKATLNQAAVAGLTTADSPAFTGVAAGNLSANGNTLSATNTNGGITLAPNGTGAVLVGNTKFTGTQILMTAGDMTLISASGSNFTMRAGANFVVTDIGQNWRLGVGAAYPGNVTIYTGSLVMGSTTRLDNAGNAILATATVGGAKDWGKLTAAPASPVEGDRYYNTTDHKLYVYDGTTWQACW